MSFKTRIQRYLRTVSKFDLVHWLTIIAIFGFWIVLIIGYSIKNRNISEFLIYIAIVWLPISNIALARWAARLFDNSRLLILWPALIILFYCSYRASIAFGSSHIFWAFFYFYILLLLFLLFVLTLVSRLRRRSLRDWYRVLHIPQVLKLTVIVAIIFSMHSLNQQNQELRKELSIIEERLGGVQKINCSSKEAVEKARASTVRIVGGDAEGSGFAIEKPNWIVTNFHVVEYEPWPMIILPNNQKVRGQVILTDKDVDLAIIKVKNLSLPRLSWANSDYVQPAEEIISLGFPFGGTLPGEATITKGYLSGRRLNDKDEYEYLQMDNTFNPGASGGPMIDICGEVIGINIAGGSGLGLGISSKTAKKAIHVLSNTAYPDNDVYRYNINPQQGPVQTVQAFYHYLRIGKMKKAYDLVSKNMMKEISFADWKKGYNKTLSTNLLSAKEVPNRNNIVEVKLTTKDLVGNQIIYSNFEGTWEVREENGQLKLYDAAIAKINPDWLWFYDFEGVE